MFFKPRYIARNFIISLDFDGVLAHGINIKRKYAYKWFGVRLSIEQTKQEGFEALMKKLGKNDVNYRSLMDPLNEKHIMEYEISPHCLQVLHKLYSEGFRFVVITSRNNHDYPYAVNFLKRNFGHLIKYVHNTRNEPKALFVKRLKPRIHVDDDLNKLREIFNCPVDCVYYRQPENYHQNRSFGDRNIYEVKDWHNFYEIAHSMKELHEAVCFKNGWKNNHKMVSRIISFCRSCSDEDIKNILDNYKTKKG